MLKNLMLMNLFMFITIGCELGDQSYIDVAGDSLPTEVTYSKHVKTIVDSSCLVCHSKEKGEAADGVSYDSYTEVKNGVSGLIETGVDEQSMPPGGYLRLTPYEKALLEKWQSDGLVE